jgi:hypothetical protein
MTWNWISHNFENIKYVYGKELRLNSLTEICKIGKLRTFPQVCDLRLYDYILVSHTHQSVVVVLRM